ncbi:MAG: hypothetical protein B7Z45_05780, partial [Azorhizobium sp. 12-66-6]
MRPAAQMGGGDQPQRIDAPAHQHGAADAGLHHLVQLEMHRQGGTVQRVLVRVYRPVEHGAHGAGTAGTAGTGMAHRITGQAQNAGAVALGGARRAADHPASARIDAQHDVGERQLPRRRAREQQRQDEAMAEIPHIRPVILQQQGLALD